MGILYSHKHYTFGFTQTNLRLLSTCAIPHVGVAVDDRTRNGTVTPTEPPVCILAAYRVARGAELTRDAAGGKLMAFAA